VKEGPANQSYGLQVAALAGIPKSVTSQARRYLTELERERDALRKPSSPQGELPLFAPALPAPAPTAALASPGSAAGAPASPSTALAALRGIDPDALSPREALDLVYRLKHLDEADHG
jgi:DNA mismatch repair protein MutS